MTLIAEGWPSSKTVVVAGVPLLAFSGCDYLGLSHHPQVLRALQDGAARYGLGANGSRITTGNTRAHGELESRLAAFCGAEAAVVLSSGTLANAAACDALFLDRNVALCDSGSHSSLLRAAATAGASHRTFVHGDASAAAESGRALDAQRSVLMSDGLFAASGDVAPVAALLRLAPVEARLLLDDSHALGVLGPRGAGSLDEVREDPRVVVTASLGKALGCCGGVVLGPRRDVERIVRHSPSFRGSTPLPPALASAAVAALDVLEAGSDLARLRGNLTRVRAVFHSLGLPLPPPQSPIFSFGADDRLSVELEAAAQQAGVLLPHIDYPGGPAPRYFRVAISAVHDDSDVQRLADVLGLALCRAGG